MKQTVEEYEGGVLVNTYEVDMPDAPPSPEERIAALESRLDAVAAKADEAAVTAQEVADAARARRP